MLRAARVWNTIRQKALGSIAEGQAGEIVFGGCQLARLGLCHKNTFLALRFTPVTSFQRLPEPLTVYKEMCVPRLTALFECQFLLL